MKNLQELKESGYIVITGGGYKPEVFKRIEDAIGYYDDIKNTQEWANASGKYVFIAHRFDTIGKIDKKFDTEEEAKEYAYLKNEIFAIYEELTVDDIADYIDFLKNDLKKTDNEILEILN